MDGVSSQWITERLRDRYLQNINDYTALTAEWFAHLILTRPKYEIDHSHDPPWDSSGRLVRVSDKLEYATYATVEEFLESEVTGESRATHVSHCGFYHCTYREDFDELTVDWLFEQAEKVVMDLVEDSSWRSCLAGEQQSDHLEQAGVMVSEILLDDDISDFIGIEAQEEVQQYILDRNPRVLFLQGEFAARKKKADEEKARLIGQEHHRTALSLWEKIEYLHRVEYGQDLTQKVNMFTYDERIAQIIALLVKRGTKPEHIRLLGIEPMALFFSNSVRTLLAQYDLDDR